MLFLVSAVLILTVVVLSILGGIISRENALIHNALEDLEKEYEKEHNRCGAYFTLALQVFRKLDDGEPYQEISAHMSREMERFAFDKDKDREFADLSERERKVRDNAHMLTAQLAKECYDRDNQGKKGTDDIYDGTIYQGTLFKVLASKSAVVYETLTVKSYLKIGFALFKEALLYKKVNGKNPIIGGFVG